MKPIKDFSRGKRTLKTQTPSGKGGPTVPNANRTITPNGKQAFQQPSPPRPQSGLGISNPPASKPKGGKTGFSF